MTKLKHHILLMITAVMCSVVVFAKPPPDSYLIVVNSEVKVESVSSKDLRSLFTLKRQLWQDGTPVQVVTLQSKMSDHSEFIQSVLRLFPYQVKRLWERQVFTGSARRPIQVDNYEKLIEQVGNTRGAIGYIKQSQLKAKNNGKVIFINIH